MVPSPPILDGWTLWPSDLSTQIPSPALLGGCSSKDGQPLSFLQTLFVPSIVFSPRYFAKRRLQWNRNFQGQSDYVLARPASFTLIEEVLQELRAWRDAGYEEMVSGARCRDI